MGSVNKDDPTKSAVQIWTRESFSLLVHDSEIVSVVLGEEDDIDRYVVVFAARELSQRQAAEVWLENGEIASINSLGEGAPSEGTAWPWEE